MTGAGWRLFQDSSFMTESPESFGAERLHNLIGGDWVQVGESGAHSSPIDGTLIVGPPRIDHQTAVDAVALAAQQHTSWLAGDAADRAGGDGDARP